MYQVTVLLHVLGQLLVFLSDLAVLLFSIVLMLMCILLYYWEIKWWWTTASLPVIAEIETLKNGIQTIVTTKLFHPTTASTHYIQLTGYRSQQRHTMPIMLYVLWQIWTQAN